MRGRISPGEAPGTTGLAHGPDFSDLALFALVGAVVVAIARLLLAAI
jgi:hypothetical protein